MRVFSWFRGLPALATLLVALVSAPAAIAGNGNVSANVTASGVVVSLVAGDAISLRVVGPEGAVVDRHIQGSQLSWSVSGATAGNYRYEALAKRRVGTDDRGDTVYETIGRTSGGFRVEAGAIRTDAQQSSLSVPERAFGAVMEWLVPAAHAADVDIDDTTPQINFNDTDTGDTEFTVTGSESKYEIFDPKNAFDVLEYDKSTNGTNFGSGKLFIASDGTTDIDPGDRIGFFTTAPAADLHLQRDDPEFRITNTAAADQSWQIEGEGTALQIVDVSNNERPVTFETGSGEVGFGTATPGARLHVQRDGGGSTTAPLIVDNPNGKARFVMASSGKGWTFDNVEGTSFDISRVGTGSAEMRVFENGDATFLGEVTANGVQLTSSREAKHDIESVDATALLERVERLPLSQWSYKGESARHVGPMAEDFHAAFGLGSDNRHVSPADMAGIALASAKALNGKLEAKDKRIDKLEQRLQAQKAKLEDYRAAMKERNANLQARVDELAGMVGRMATRLGEGDDQVASAQQ